MEEETLGCGLQKNNFSGTNKIQIHAASRTASHFPTLLGVGIE
jgi:hypothetical protein